MHSFKDKAGRSWEIHGHFGSWSRVKSACGVDLTDIATEERKSLTQLADTFTLGNVIWTLVEPQAIDRGVSPDAFYAAMDGDVLVAAHLALLEEMVFFCPSRVRTILLMMIERIKAAEAEADRQLARHLPAVEREIEAAIESLTFGDTDASSPESLASTPETGACASSTSPSCPVSESDGITPAPLSLKSQRSTGIRSKGRSRMTHRKSTR